MTKTSRAPRYPSFILYSLLASTVGPVVLVACGSGGDTGSTSRGPTTTSSTGAGGAAGGGDTGGAAGAGVGGSGGMGGAGGGCQAFEEICNGVDDNCNGLIDEELAPITCGIGACQVTVEGCANGQVPTCSPLTPAVAETCDGAVDDDCDGSIDQGCSCTDGQTMPCYGGPMGTDGVGECASGQQTCAGGAWGSCIGAVLPSPEACNSLDDDCNGAADDALGVVSCGVGACSASAPACENGQPGMCVPGAPSAESCNGVDDDCNGAVDEGLGVLSCGVGSCAATAPACENGQPGTCAPGMPTAEACNGVDDDCNGSIDDGSAASLCPMLPNGTSTCQGGSCGLGGCTGAFADCDQNAQNGCEKDISSSNDACGACGAACGAGQSCYASACSDTCPDNKAMTFPVQGCTNLASGKPTSASSVWVNGPGPAGPSRAVDGNFCTGWNAGGYAPAWWQVDLGQDTPVRGVTLGAGMVPSGNVVHQVQTSSDGIVWDTRVNIAQNMTNGDVYPFDFNAVYTVRYVRISTTSSPSWVGWREVAVWGC